MTTSKPFFEQEQPLFLCPKCHKGIVRYRFEFTPSGTDYADWSECDTFPCHEQYEVQLIEELPLVIISEGA